MLEELNPDFSDFTYSIEGAEVVITYKGKTTNVSELLAVPDDPYGVIQVLSSHAGYLVWFGTATASAEADLATAKDDLEIIEAEVDKSIRVRALSKGEKTTEPGIEKAIKLDESYQEALLYKIDCNRRYLVLRKIYEAFQARGNLLPSISGFLRDEAKQPYAGN